ncbi:MAG: gamma-glutamyltransferase [Bacteroidota bacterium]|nr:gamma-glutamyltransferase [Bacteroidota bacterium]
MKNKPSTKYFFSLSLILLIAVFSSSCNTKNQTESGILGVIAEKAMVVSAHPEASRIGVKIMEQGGNAVDAACAVQFALAVSHPSAGNIGGGGFMIIRFADGTISSLDFREKAPALADRDMYLDENGKVIPDLSIESSLAVGVPGSVDGIIKASERYGKLSFNDIIQPSIDLARNGFPVSEKMAASFNRIQKDLKKQNSKPVAFIKEGGWVKGDTLKQPELANCLSLIRDHGRDGFYSGETARNIVSIMKEKDGLISIEDLEAYNSVWRDPVVGNYKGHKIISMGPPSSGGIALNQLLTMVEPYPLNDWGWHDKRSVHLMTEAERRVYADRAEYLGDSDFYPVPQKGLLEESYLKERMQDFDMDHATPSSKISHGKPALVESEETTHLSIIDPEGNAVAVTTTINGSYGTRIVVAGSGFLLNNEMDDFSSKPGTPNMFGLLGGEANAIEPDKRMLSAMTPTIVEKDGKLLMVVGTPGGSTIITSVFQTILNVLDHGMGMQEAVNASRIHHQWMPDVVFYEKGSLNKILMNELIDMGHELKERSSIGRVDAILVRKDGSLEGGADQRGDDTSVGLN